MKEAFDTMMMQHLLYGNMTMPEAPPALAEFEKLFAKRVLPALDEVKLASYSIAEVVALSRMTSEEARAAWEAIPPEHRRLREEWKARTFGIHYGTSRVPLVGPPKCMRMPTRNLSRKQRRELKRRQHGWKTNRMREISNAMSRQLRKYVRKIASPALREEVREVALQGLSTPWENSSNASASGGTAESI